MARVLVCTGPGQVDLIDRPDPPLGAGQVRIETLYSGISAGTEGTIVRGTNPYLAKRWDAGRRLFLDGSEPSLRYPVETWGYEEVGRVVEVADDVTDPPPGSLVYGTWGHRERHVASADEVRWRTVPDRLDPVAGIFSHMTAIALNGVLDADLAIGETAVVFGLGVPGQIVVQLAARSGARVVAVDPIAARRELARRLTPAATALDPRDASVAEAVRDLTDGRGADVAIEASGAVPALHEAIRSVAYASRVVAMGFYQGEPVGLRLGDEYHHNRIELRASQISGVHPSRAHRWDRRRLVTTGMRLQAEGVLSLTPLITDVLPFGRAAEAFDRLASAPNEVLQIVLRTEAAT